MEIKPPVAIAILVVVLALLVGGFSVYQKHQMAAMTQPGTSHPTTLPGAPPGVKY